jgi:hypothetical protein
MRVKILTCRKWEIGRDHDEDAADYDQCGIFVVSDGAGSGSYASQWSRALVAHSITAPLRSAAPTEVNWWLRGARARFSEMVPAVSIDRLPPHLRNTARRGAFATFHQMRFACTGDGKLSAHSLSIGDTCVFLLRCTSGNMEMHPRKEAKDFDRPPQLMTSSADEFDPYIRVLESQEFSELQPGDVLLAATDAVARWLVVHGVDMARVLQLLEFSDSHWNEWIQQQRDARTIGNDDSTLMIIQISAEDLSGDAFSVLQADPQRTQELEEALQREDSFSIAEAWGDGSAIWAEKRDELLSQVEPHLRIYEAVQRMRAVLNAFHHQAATFDDVLQHWRVWERILINSRAGIGIHSALEEIGVTVRRSSEEDR